MDSVSFSIRVLMSVARFVSLSRPPVFFGIPDLIYTLFVVGAGFHIFSECCRIGRFHYVVFTGGVSVLVIGLLLVLAGMALYLLVRTALPG